MSFDFAAIAISIGAVARGGHWSWLGAATPPIAMLGFFTFLMLGRVARTSLNLLPLHLLGLAGATVSLLSSPAAIALATTGVALNLLYAFGYSKLDVTRSRHLVVGKALPKIELEDVTGALVTNDALLGTPRLMLFYRGNWCPLCMAQIREIAQSYRRLADRGIAVALISPQPHDNTRSLAQKFEVDFEFFVDPGNRCATELGIAHRNGVPAGVGIGYDADTVLPTVVLTDGKGIVRWIHQTDNYRIRPEPALFLAAVDRELGDGQTAVAQGDPR